MTKDNKIEILFKTPYEKIKNNISPNIATIYTGPPDIFFNFKYGKLDWRSLDFKFKTFNEWWLFGQNIISENVADKMVNVLCTKDITEKNETIDYGSWTYIYSKCPLIKDPIEKIKNKQTENIFFYI